MSANTTSNTTTEAVPSTAASSSNSNIYSRGLDVDEIRDYLKPRVLGLAAAGAFLGSMRGYYIAEKPLNFGYKFGVVTGAISSTFYLGSYMLGVFRQTDDAINHGVSGALNFTAVSLLMKGDSYMPGVGRGIRHAAAGLLGAVAGVVFYYGGSVLFDSSRSVWVYHRSYMVQTPKPSYGIGREKMTIPVLPPNKDDIYHVFGSNKPKDVSVSSNSSNSNSYNSSNSSNSNNNSNSSNNKSNSDSKNSKT